MATICEGCDEPVRGGGVERGGMLFHNRACADYFFADSGLENPEVPGERTALPNHDWYRRFTTNEI